MNIIRNIRFFILATLCLNSLNALASEYRPRHAVPQYNKAHSKGFFIFSPFIVFGKFADAIPHIHMPNFGKLFENIDLSYGSHIIQEHKVMLSAAGALVALSLLAKRLQRSETCGKWLGEKYAQVSTSVDDYTDDYIKKCPLPVQLAIVPIKIMIQFLCGAIKNYIAMNKKTIIFSVVPPVTGRVLDYVIGCPIPLLSFTSIGGMVSGVILTKGYFDQSFEKIDEKLNNAEATASATQEKIGAVQTTIDIMGQSLTQLFSKIQSLTTGVGQIKEQVGSVGGQVKDILKKLVGMDKQIVSLQKTIEAKDTRDIEQYENLKRQLEALQKSHKQAIDLLNQKAEQDKSLMLELQEFKNMHQNDHQTLRHDLGLTATQLSKQIDGVKEEVQRGFASTHRALPGNGHVKDMQIQVLQLEAGQRSTNNS